MSCSCSAPAAVVTCKLKRSGPVQVAVDKFIRSTAGYTAPPAIPALS